MSSSTDATRELAAYIVGAAPDDLPEAVRREAARAFLNIVGCAVGGSRHAAVEIAWRALAPFAGPPQATLIGRGGSTDLLTAPLINGLSASVHIYDDTHASAIVHPSGPVVAAALAAAEHRAVSGRALLTAFALGVETVCRLSMAVSVAPARGSIAWSQSGITGGVGAAVACGKLLALDPPALRRAIGIAASQAAGIRVMHGSMCTPLMPAHAAQVGLRAALMAQAGFTSSEASLEGRYGFAECFAQEADLSLLTEGLGKRFEILANTYKPYPCGIVIHPMIDGCLRLKAEHRLDAARIAEVRVRANPAALALTDRRHPASEYEAQVSLQHWVAAVLVRGKAGIAELEQACIEDAEVAALRARVVVTGEAAMPPDATDITVRLAGGETLGCEVRHCTGSRERPMTDGELEAKFRALAEGIVPPAAVAGLIEDCWQLEKLADATALIRRLSG